jgi:integrase
MKNTYNTRFRLTPMPPTHRWRKIYKGKTYYVGIGHCSGKNDRVGYAVALGEWKDLKAKIDNSPTDAETTRYEAIQDGRKKWGELMAEVPTAILEGIKSSHANDVRIVEKVEGRKNGKGTIGQAVADFVALKMSRHVLGDLSAMRVQTIGQHLRHFEKFAGVDTPITAITEDMVVGYRQAIVGDIQAGTYGKVTAHDRWSCFKEWVRNLYQIPTPRNLNSRDLSIRKPTQKVCPFTDDDVKTLLNITHDRFRLWVLLMLNCGMYSGDIAELKPCEVNWVEGIISRKRSKEKNQENAPIVSYKLWDTTFALLKKYGKQEGDRVFGNRYGSPLVERIFKASGKIKMQDSIYDIYRRLFPDKSRKPLKALRKTGASTLATHPQYKWYADYYLGHSPKGMAEKHYIRPDDAEFFEALKWLGQKFGIA